MDCRLFLEKELEQLGLKNIIPNDCRDGKNIGILPIVIPFLQLDRLKADFISNDVIEKYINNLEISSNEGNLYIAELSSSSLSNFFRDTETFEEHINRSVNPYFLTCLIIASEDYLWDSSLLISEIKEMYNGF